MQLGPHALRPPPRPSRRLNRTRLPIDTAQAVAVYLRTYAADPDASAIATAEQRQQVAAWLLSRPTRTEVARELVEVEDGGPARPALAEAVAWCRPRAAPLVVPRTAPIGAGPAFHPCIVSVPVIVLPQPHRPAPAVIAAPDRAPEWAALYVGRRDDAGLIPLYLANLGPDALTDVIVDGSSLYLDEDRTVPTNGAHRRVGRVEPGTAVLVEERDARTAGEYLDALHVTFRQGTAELHGVVVLALRVKENQFVRLRMTADPRDL